MYEPHFISLTCVFLISECRSLVERDFSEEPFAVGADEPNQRVIGQQMRSQFREEQLQICNEFEKHQHVPSMTQAVRISDQKKDGSNNLSGNVHS